LFILVLLSIYNVTHITTSVKYCFEKNEKINLEGLVINSLKKAIIDIYWSFSPKNDEENGDVLDGHYYM
jgi:hypothetical protein